jgi:hypothetical protein
VEIDLFGQYLESTVASSEWLVGWRKQEENIAMPLRDHFRPPVWKLASWEGFHGLWPAIIVQRLVEVLPSEFTAEPRVHPGSYYEIDVCAYEDDEPKRSWSSPANGGDGIATVRSAPPDPTLTVEVDLPEQYAYEVLVFDQSRGRYLVAAVEIVSPGNKDRAVSRRAFVAKCAALLQQGVCVSLVDLVTTRDFNLYIDLLSQLDLSDPAFLPRPSSTYAVTCRCRKIGDIQKLENWAYSLVVGQPLPKIPIWLSEDQNVMLDLETSYEETCRVLRIP